MLKRNRTHLSLGIILILVALGLLYLKSNPALAESIHIAMSWPVWIILGGGTFLLIGLLTGEPEMAIPASIFAGVGVILYFQNINKDWSSWLYMWTLIPGFAGIGNILAGTFGARFRKSIIEGCRLLIISSLMFLIVTSIFGKLNILGPNKELIIAGLLLLLGVWLIIRGVIRPQPKE